jgi:release factor glutamine methyltransferase
MRPVEAVRRGAEYLARHGVAAPEANAERLMLHVLGVERAALLSRRDGLSADEAKTFGRLLCRRCSGIPLQHLTGEQGFRHLVLAVRPGVFVPRPETEIVVDAALEAIAAVGEPIVLDLGTGSGAIALSIAHEHVGAQVWATDRAPEAVALAGENAARLDLPVTVLEGDLFDPVPERLRGEVDLVVSNPPYVPEERRPHLPAEVLADPGGAVFGGPEVSRRIWRRSASWLREGGHVVLEIDDEAGEATVAMARDAGFADVTVRPDLAGRPRVVTGRRP